MSNIFANLKAYKGKFSLKETKTFDADDLIGLECEVVVGDYDTSIKFSYTSGPNEGVSYYVELDSQSQLTVGEIPDPAELIFNIYGRNGDEDIMKVMEKVKKLV